jgi:hypothetical protein
MPGVLCLLSPAAKLYFAVTSERRYLYLHASAGALDPAPPRRTVFALQEKYRSALEAASINIAELDAAAAAASAAAAAAGPTTAAARSAVRRSLGGTSSHHLLGLSPPASPEPVVHGGGRRLSGPVLKSPSLQGGGRASAAAGLPPVSPKPAFRPAGSASPGFGRCVGRTIIRAVSYVVLACCSWCWCSTVVQYDATPHCMRFSKAQTCHARMPSSERLSLSYGQVEMLAPRMVGV